MSRDLWSRFQDRQVCERDVTSAEQALKGLSSYWLSPPAQQLCRELWGEDWSGPQARVPEPGACWPIFINADTRTHALLRSAMTLPLIWRRRASHDERLPQPLRNLADEVLASFAAARPPVPADGTSWGLAYSLSEGETPDLGALAGDEFSPRSAWAALAGGLIQAVEGLSPDVRIWATARWDNGVRGVEGVRAKVQLALGESATRLFVPDCNQVEAESALRELSPASSGELPRLKILGLRSDQPDPVKALGPYLAHLMVRPSRPDHAVGDDGPLDRWRGDLANWYERVYQFDPNEASRRHTAEIVPEIGEYLRSRHSLGEAPLSHLILIASHNGGNLVPMIVNIVRPHACLVLYSSDEQGMHYRGEVEAALKAISTELADRTVYRAFAMDHTLRRRLARLTAEFTTGVPREQVIYDLTPGQFLAKLALIDDCVRSGNAMAFLDHEFSKAIKSPRPFSQRLVFWRHGEKWLLPPSANAEPEASEALRESHSP